MKGRMKKLVRIAVLFCLTAVLLGGTAAANSAPPDYLLAVKLANAPEEAYYLDLLVPADTNGGVYCGAKREDPEFPALDGQMLETLSGAVPDRWAAYGEQTGVSCYWGALTGKNGIHQFSGMDSRKYRILIATKSGETWVSEEMERRAVQDAVRVDWAAKEVRASPRWLAAALQTLSTLLPTLAVEGLLLPAFGFGWKKNWKPFLLINLATQGALALFLSIRILQHGTHYYDMLFDTIMLIPVELVITFAEAYLCSRFFQGRSERRAFAYGITANTASFLLGLFLVPLAWTNFVLALWLGI